MATKPQATYHPWLRLSAFALIGVLSIGCAFSRVPVQPAPGLLFTSIDAPLSVDLDGEPLGDRRGKASAYYIRVPWPGNWSFGIGDASIEAAMAQGDIQTLRHADYHQFQVLGVFGNFEVIAYGE